MSSQSPDPVPPLGQFHALRDGGVRRNGTHVQELVDAQAENVGEIGIESDQTAANAQVQHRIDHCPATEAIRSAEFVSG